MTFENPMVATFKRTQSRLGFNIVVLKLQSVFVSLKVRTNGSYQCRLGKVRKSTQSKEGCHSSFYLICKHAMALTFCLKSLPKQYI